MDASRWETDSVWCSLSWLWKTVKQKHKSISSATVSSNSSLPPQLSLSTVNCYFMWTWTWIRWAKRYKQHAVTYHLSQRSCKRLFLIQFLWVFWIQVSWLHRAILCCQSLLLDRYWADTSFVLFPSHSLFLMIHLISPESNGPKCSWGNVHRE